MHASAVSTQYTVEAIPEPPVSAGVKIIVKSAVCHPAGASSVVVGALLSTLIFSLKTSSTFPALSVDWYLKYWFPSVSIVTDPE